MTEDNDLLLKQFFSEAAEQQIDDNGFSQRVISQLPPRVNWFTRVWTLCCVIAFGVLFVVFDGMDLLAIQLEVMLRTLAVQSFSVNLLMVGSILSGLLIVCVSEVISSETYRKWYAAL